MVYLVILLPHIVRVKEIQRIALDNAIETFLLVDHENSTNTAFTISIALAISIIW